MKQSRDSLLRKTTLVRCSEMQLRDQVIPDVHAEKKHLLSCTIPSIWCCETLWSRKF